MLPLRVARRFFAALFTLGDESPESHEYSLLCEKSNFADDFVARHVLIMLRCRFPMRRMHETKEDVLAELKDFREARRHEPG